MWAIKTVVAFIIAMILLFTAMPLNGNSEHATLYLVMNLASLSLLIYAMYAFVRMGISILAWMMNTTKKELE